jgi:hypothetical protein
MREGRPDTPHQAGGGDIVRALLKMAAAKLQKKRAPLAHGSSPPGVYPEWAPRQATPLAPVLEEAAQSTREGSGGPLRSGKS